MKLLHVVRGLSNSSGTTHVVVPLSEELVRHGHEVTVMFVDKGQDAPVLPDPSLVNAKRFALSLPFANPGVSFSFSRAVRASMASFDFVHVHAVWNYPSWKTMAAARQSNVPYMVSPQGSFEPWALAQSRWKKRVYGVLTEMPLMRKAACIQALTQTEAEQVRAMGIKAPCEVIPNGIERRNFERAASSLARRLGLDSGQRTLLFVSRLHPKKGADILIEAFARLRQRYGDITLVIAGGDGGSGYGDTLRALAAQHGVEADCRFIGEISGNTKFDIVSGADVFVLPSHSEGLPVAVIEAMAAGVPVVITPGCNLAEVALANAGRISQPEPDALAATLEDVFARRAAMRQMGENARRLVAERFTWQKIAADLSAVYERYRTKHA